MIFSYPDNYYFSLKEVNISNKLISELIESKEIQSLRGIKHNKRSLIEEIDEEFANAFKFPESNIEEYRGIESKSNKLIEEIDEEFINTFLG